MSLDELSKTNDLLLGLKNQLDRWDGDRRNLATHADVAAVQKSVAGLSREVTEIQRTLDRSAGTAGKLDDHENRIRVLEKAAERTAGRRFYSDMVSGAFIKWLVVAIAAAVAFAATTAALTRLLPAPIPPAPAPVQAPAPPTP